MGVPRAPKATGAVFAISDKPEAANGEKPRPIKIAAVTATGYQNRRLLQKRTKCKSDQQQLQATVFGDAGDGILQYFETAILLGELMQKYDVQHNPADRQQAREPSVKAAFAAISVGMP